MKAPSTSEEMIISVNNLFINGLSKEVRFGVCMAGIWCTFYTPCTVKSLYSVKRPRGFQTRLHVVLPLLSWISSKIWHHGCDSGCFTSVRVQPVQRGQSGRRQFSRFTDLQVQTADARAASSVVSAPLDAEISTASSSSASSPEPSKCIAEPAQNSQPKICR